MVWPMQERSEPIRLNAGCGLAYREGYINFDLRPRDAHADLAADLLALPFAAGVADQVVLSHVLEHVDKHEVLQALLEARRALRVGGTLALEVPDLEYCVRLWLNTPDPHRWRFPLDAIYGDQTHPGQFHKTGFSRARLTELVERAGLMVEQAGGGTSHGVEVIRLLARRPAAFESRSDLGPRLNLEDDLGLGRGWWGVERGDAGAFRWTAGDAVAYLRAPQTGNRQVRLAGHVSLEHVPEGRLVLRLCCDGIVAAELDIEKSGPIAVTASLPSAMASEEFHGIQLSTRPWFYVPGDERQLGIIVRELAFGE